MILDYSVAELARETLSGDRGFDAVQFVDRLLPMVPTFGEIRCTLAGENNLRFEFPGQPACEIELSRTRTKLRLLCARLAVLIGEHGSIVPPIHGGEGEIEVNNAAVCARSMVGVAANGPTATPTNEITQAMPIRLHVSLVNTPGTHEFTIRAI